MNISFEELEQSGILDHSDLIEDIQCILSDIDKDIAMAESISGIITDIQKVKITDAETKVMKNILLPYNTEGVELVTRKDILNTANIAYESILSTIKDKIMELISKIVDLIKKFVAFNRILANTLDKEIKNGIFANMRKTNMGKFNTLVVAMYKKIDLLTSLATIKRFRYTDITGEELLSNALNPVILDAFKKLGWVVSGNNVSFENKKIAGEPLGGDVLQWKMEDIQKAAKDIHHVLMNNLLEGNRTVKILKQKVKSENNANELKTIKLKLAKTQKTVSIIQKIGTTLAMLILRVGHKLK